MESNITVNDIDVLNELLKSIIKVVPSAKFIVNKDGVQVKVKNESQTLRAFFKSDCMTSDDEKIFCFRDVMNFKKSIELIKNIEDKTECVLQFSDSFMKYSNEVKFKLKILKEEVIEQYVTVDLKTKLKKIFSFTTESGYIKQVMQCTNIMGESDSKVYFSQKQSNVICELDDKSNKLSNSVGIPISDDLDGEIESDSEIIMSLDNFQAFSILPSDEIKITYTDKNVFEAKSEYESIELYLVATTLKK